MTLTRNLLSDAVRYGLSAGAVGMLGLAANPAFAQDTTTPAPADQKAKNLERIEVVGSRIKRAVDYESTAPVTTLTRADIEQTGLTTTFDIINHISASDGSGLSTVTSQTNGSDGTQTVSLRNLGPQRTLILVDGRRWVTGGGGGSGDAGIVDLSTIPVAIIERIEVLKDGASAIYGSDAVAGVINIITRKKYEGAQVGWYYGQTSRGDGSQNTEDVTIGASGERSSGVISVSRSEQKTIFAGNRKLTDAKVAGCDEVLSNWPASDPKHLAGACGSFISQFGAFYVPSVSTTFLTLNNSFQDTHNGSVDPALARATADGRDADDFHVNNRLDRYNFAPVNYLQQPAIRNNLYMSGRFDITDNVSAFARASYSQRQSSQQLAQVPQTANTTGGSGPQWAFGISGANVFNPFHADVPIAYFRHVAVGPRHNNYDFNVLGTTGGLEGSFKLGDRSFDWDLYAQYNSSNSTKIGEHYLNLFNLAKALGPSFRDGAGVLHCGTVGAIIAGCVPFNEFGGPDLGLSHGVISKAEYDAMVQYISYTEVQTNKVKGINYGANISGEIVPLQGGMLSFAAGLESRRDRALFQPDALVSGGGSSDNFTEATSGRTKVDEAYLEFDVPLLKGLPGAQELEFNVAARKSRYSASGLVGVNEVTSNPGNPINYKYSVRWKPITDLLLRGSYGDTFRAPSVNDLFSGGSENFPAATDPCNTNIFPTLSAAGQALCLAGHVPPGGVTQINGQLRALAGGNPALTPEKGKNLTYGFVYSPSFVSGLNLTVDYWRITLKDALFTLGAQTILDNCYQVFIGDPNYCSKVIRTSGGTVQEVRTAQFNLSNLKVEGVDFGLTYKHDIGNMGTFGVKSDTTYNKHELVDGAEVIGLETGSPNWKWRSVLTLDWTKGDWDAAWTARYTSALEENGGCNRVNGAGTPVLRSLTCNHPNEVGKQPNLVPGLGFNRMGAVVYNDLQIGWKAPWKAHLSVGARNIFGKEPPIVSPAGTFANSFDASYDLPGGPFYYFQYRQDF